MRRQQTTKDYERRLEQLDRMERKLGLKKQVEDREKELGLRRTPKKPAWSKVLMAAMVFICFEIIFFAEVVMWTHGDFSALYALIGVPASLAAAIWAYSIKSKAENTEGGIVYDLAMREKDGEDAEG